MDKKWNLQDIKPATPRKRRAQQPVASTEPEVESSATVADDVEEVETKINQWSAEKPKNNRISRYLVIGALLVAVLVGGFGISALMDGAKITVYPRHREPTVNAVFVAKQEPIQDELGYELMTLEAEGERQVTASGEEQVSEQATGSITIFKTTAGSERLIKNTRFESPEGLIYRITESVVVPGGTSDEPGQVEAEVFADEAGDEYNLGANVRFSIPGFAEGGFTELFESIYAVNQNSISGGYDGPRYIVEESDLEEVMSGLHQELQDALAARVDSEKPAGFAVFNNAAVFSFESLPSEQVDDSQVILKEKASLSIPIFDLDSFAAFIAKNTIPGYEDEPVRIDRIEELSFAYSATSTDSVEFATDSELSFRLTGTPLLVWTFDEESLKADLAGAARTALNTVLGGYPAIEKAEAVVRPVWKRSFPEKVEDISITESLAERE